MDVRKLELKSLKRADKRAKRQHVTLWKAFALIFLATALILTPVSIAAKIFDNAVAVYLDSSFCDFANVADDAVFFSDQAPPLLTSEQTYRQIQAEGVVLLENANNALPLQKGEPVNCIAYNAEKTQDLQSELANLGMSVEENAGTVIAALTGEDQTLLTNLAQKKSSGEIQKIILLWDTATPAQPDFWKDSGADAVLWTGGADGESVAALLSGASPDGSLPYTGAYTNNKEPNNGFYTGYFYFETRYEDYVMGAEGAGEYVYPENVAYPFGFGLGYTTFAYSDLQVVYDDQGDCFSVTLTVTNTGDKIARETVQVYAQSPYTDYDKENGVEKPAVKLVGFAKTDIMEPGMAATVSVQVSRQALASYDSQGAGTYILEAGDYYLTAAANAHDAINHILAAKGYTPENTQNRMDTAGDAQLAYCWTQKTTDYGVCGAAVFNRYDTQTQGPSRQDWEGTLSRGVTAVAQNKTQYSPGEYPSASMPTTGAKNGLKLYDLKGLAFDDPKWQTLLDQLTVAEMAALIGDAYGCFLPVESVQAPGARYAETKLFADMQLLMATFNTDLAYAAGYHSGNSSSFAGQMLIWETDDNLEDSFLAGNFYARQAKGLSASGLPVALKTGNHWLSGSEQTIREKHLRIWQYAIEEIPTTGIVTAESRLVGILRQEWNGLGVAMAENVSAVDGVMAGFTAFADLFPKTGDLLRYRDDPVVVSALRQACHYQLYTVANSAAMNGIGPHTVVKTHWLWSVTVCVAVTGVCYIAGVVFAALWSRGSKKWKKTEAHLAYKTLKNTLKAEKKANKKLPE